MTPHLSVIIPVYNKANYLDACLKSIQNQTFIDFELILINDGSKDNSGEICDRYSLADKRVTVLHQQNQGVSAARNNGLKIVKGNYVGFIDADDTIAADMFELLVSNAAKTDADISICSIQITDDENASTLHPDKVKVSVLNKSQTLSALLSGSINWSANNKIYKRHLATNVKFEGRINEDLLYCFNVIGKMEAGAVFQDIAKYNYIKRDNSVSLAKFDVRQMESVGVSKKILSLVKDRYPAHLHEAKLLDFISNLSVLNLAILAGQQQSAEYAEVKKTLRSYTEFRKKTAGLSAKQQYAFTVFMFSPQLYSTLLKVYCKLIPSEAGKKVL